tara:strand:+ start:1820 stop:2755 length:936 start_codon:yes stop_codon:yes gene_type:complete
MPELNTIESPKIAGFVDRGYNNNKKRAAMEAEEKEIARLEAEARGEEYEEESDGEGSEATKVSDAGDSKQKEAKAEVEASEDDSNLSREEKSFKKRYGDLRRHMAEKEKDWNERFEKLENSGGTILPPKTDEDIDQWVSKYPDVASIVQTIATKKAQELFSKADTRLQKLDEMHEATVRKSAETTIIESHADFINIRESDEFHDWADEQPKWVQDAVYENTDDPHSVVRVLDLYKVDKGLTKEAKKAGKKAAASVVSRTSKTKVDADDSDGQIRESDVAKMSSKDFETNVDEINKAMRTGKFIYDISGSAR